MTPQKPLDLHYAPGMTPPKRRRGLFGWFLFVGLAIMFVMLMRRSSAATTTAPLFQLKADIEAGNVRDVTIADGEATYTANSSIAVNPAYPMVGPFRVILPDGLNHDWNFIHWLMDVHNGRAAVVLIGGQNDLVLNLLLPLIPWLLIFGFLWFFVFRQMRSQRNQPKQPMPVVIVNPEAMQ